MSSHDAAPVSPAPLAGPKLYAPSPDDHLTLGTGFWTVAAVIGLAVQAYGVYHNWKEPGNRDRWTLSENLRPWSGYDSQTGVPLDVRFGAARRVAAACFWGWAPRHWYDKQASGL